VIWERLRDKQLGVVIKTQYVLFGYIADFYCHQARLVIEIDGPHHAKRKVYDMKRDEVMRKNGYDTIRIASSLAVLFPHVAVALIAKRIAQRLGMKTKER